MLIPSPGCEGDFHVLIMVCEDEDVRSDILRTIFFSIHPEPSLLKPAPFATPPGALAASSAISAALEEALLKKGAMLLRNGDLSAARLNFETLALRGSAKGAYALGQTFDPVILAPLPVAGLKPNLEKAKEWYGRAARFGSKDAAQRLSELLLAAKDTTSDTQILRSTFESTFRTNR
jgi:hypothetical protein